MSTSESFPLKFAALAALSIAALAAPLARAQDKPAAQPALALPASGPEIDALNQLPSYQPSEKVSGTIRLWTRPARFFGALVKAWDEGFHKFQPDAKISYGLYGTAAVVGGLYEDAADIGILGEEIHPSAVAAFERIKHYPPTTIEIATCAYDVKNFGAANVFFVNRENPLTQATLAQLDGILSDEHKRGAGKIRTWGQMGLTGEWADQRIHPYTWLLAESFCLYLRHAILEDSHRWNPDIQEFVAGKKPDGSPYDDGEQILDHVSNDKYGIGVSSVTFLKPAHQVKPLALSRDDGGPFYPANKENLIWRRYPLTRLIPAAIDRAPGEPLAPKVREFLRYLLSREGQSDFVRTHGYLPLNKDALQIQLKKLD